MLKKLLGVSCLCLLGAGCSGSQGPSKDLVKQSMQKVLPVPFQVLDVRQVKEIPGLYQVALKTASQPIVVYMDSKAKYLISGSLMALDTKTNLTLESQKNYQSR
jgi:protein-disulfide isomerase